MNVYTWTVSKFLLFILGLITTLFSYCMCERRSDRFVYWDLLGAYAWIGITLVFILLQDNVHMQSRRKRPNS